MTTPRRSPNLKYRFGVTAGAALTAAGLLVVAAGPAAAADLGTQTVFGWHTSGTVLPEGGYTLPGGFTIPASDRTGIVSMAASPTAVLAVRTDGSVATWPVFGFPAAPAEAQSGVRQVDPAQTYALAVKDDGTVIAWGDDSAGTVSVPAEDRTGVTAVAAGDRAAYVLKDGGVRTWGSEAVPVPTAAQSDVRAIDAGQYTVAAVKSDGTVVAWCPHNYGPTTCDAPPGLTGVTQVSSGFGSFLAVKSDGTVVGWGRETTDSVPVAARSGVVSVSASDNDLRIAVKGDGTVVSWQPGNPLATPTVVQGRVSGAIAGNAFFLSWFSADSPPVFTGGNAPTGTVGGSYSINYAMTGSPAPTVALTDGALPPGMSLSSAGVLSGTPSKAGVFPFTLTATNSVGTATSTQRLIINPATTGQLANSAPPVSVQAGAWESDTTARIFAEQANQVLSAPLTVGGTTIPTGTRINSYYLHADPVGNANTAHPYAGTVNFGTKILAVARSTDDLQATTPALGLTGTTYSSGSDQGLEYDDTTTVSNQTKLTFGLNVYNSSDAIRIITLAP